MISLQLKLQKKIFFFSKQLTFQSVCGSMSSLNRFVKGPKHFVNLLAQCVRTWILPSQELNKSRLSLRRIFHKDLGVMRFRFARWADDRLAEDENFYAEAWAMLTSGPEPFWAHVIIVKPLQPQRVTVWLLLYVDRQHHWIIFSSKMKKRVTVIISTHLYHYACSKVYIWMKCCIESFQS